MSDLVNYVSGSLSSAKCQFNKTGLTLSESLTKPEWEELGNFLRNVAGSVQFWVGDWIRFGERQWGEMYDKAQEATGLDYGTLRNIKSVSESVELSRRHDNLSFSHHQEVATLSPENQETLLNKAEEEGLSTKELRNEVRLLNRKEVKAVSLPDGEFNVIYADPPWKYEFSETDSRQIENKYPTMELEEIKSLQIPSAENAVLLLWATAPKLDQAIEVLTSWGFMFKTCAIWDKEIMGMGYWFRGQHEILLVGTRGQFSPPAPENRYCSVIREKRTEHSQKPLCVYDMIEKMFPTGKYLELFARNDRPNWASFGNQL